MEDDADVTSPPGLEDENMDDFMDDSEPGKDADLTGDGGVVKKILHVGDGWETPSKGDEVTVHYVGTLENGEKFDSSRDRDEPFVFKLGTGSVIKGWDEGVKTMKRGEKAELICRADYAYGEQGSPPKIPPNATLKFEVELLFWKSIKDIAGDGGVIKTIQTEGSGWQKPSDKDEALVKYSVRVAGSGAPVASSSADGDVLAVGRPQPLKAFPVALKTMKEGEKALLHIKPEYGYAGEGRPAEVPPDAELEAELELVLIRKVEDVSDNGSVMKKLIKKGEEYKRPNEGATVKIAYTAHIGGPDGPIFDERTKEDPLQFIVDNGDEGVVEGLDMAVLKMNLKETVEVTIAPQYGYGDAEHRGSAAVVPPNSTLHYTVELLELQKAKESWDMNAEEKLESAEQRKETGNAFFKAGKWDRAIKKYKAAANAIDYDKDFPAEVKSKCSALKKSAHLNSAAANIKLGRWKDAIASANKVLASDPSNVKALYRRAQAYLGLQDFVEAQVDIKAALQSEPSNKDVRALQARYKKEAAAANQRDAKMYKSIFEKLAKMPDRGTKAGSKAESKEDSGMPAASENENKAEAANGAEKPEINGHPEINGIAQEAAVQPMVVDAQA